MAKSANLAILLGNVGRDPEMRTVGNGTLLAQFSLATTERIKDASGKWADHTEWHNLVAFGHNAEVVRDYVKKGSRIYVEGRIETRSWEDRGTGKKNYTTQIRIDNLVLTDGRPEPAANSEPDGGGWLR